MTTPTREELLKLAKEAGFSTYNDGTIAADNGSGLAITCTVQLERFAALLYAHQAQGEPVAVIGDTWTLYWAGSEPVAEIARRHGLKVGAKLYAAPPSSAQTDQVWNEAVEAAAKMCAPHAFAEYAIRSLKRPLQAQERRKTCAELVEETLAANGGVAPRIESWEPSASPAAQSGAVDELPQIAYMTKRGAVYGGCHCDRTRGDTPLVDGDKARAALSRAQTAPALEADLAWHKTALARHAEKLHSVWNGISHAVEKYSGKPCEGEPFDRLDELLAALSADAAQPVSKELRGRLRRAVVFMENGERVNIPQLAKDIDALLSQSAAPVSEQPAAQTAGVPEIDVAEFLRGRFLTDVGMRAYLNGDPIQFYPLQIEAIVKAAAAPQPVAEQVGIVPASELTKCRHCVSA